MSERDADLADEARDMEKDAVNRQKDVIPVARCRCKVDPTVTMRHEIACPDYFLGLAWQAWRVNKQDGPSRLAALERHLPELLRRAMASVVRYNTGHCKWSDEEKWFDDMVQDGILADDRPLLARMRDGGA